MEWSAETRGQLLRAIFGKEVVGIVPEEVWEEVLATLQPRQRLAIELRFRDKLTLARAAPLMPRQDGGQGVTKERVRQMETKALRRCRHPIRSSKLKPYMKGAM